jgi:hypothetical protein
MTRIICVAAIVTLLGSVEPSTAQLLSTGEVRELMASPAPANHVKLHAHFTALSTRYDTDASRHTAFARSAAGTSRGANAAAASHHERLAALALESATITSALATHHRTLSTGEASTAPRGGEVFEAGAGAPAIPPEKRLQQLAVRAERPSEHGQVREYYLMLAKEYEADAKEHRTMARMYRGISRANESSAAQCDRLGALAGRSAREARALAREH